MMITDEAIKYELTMIEKKTSEVTWAITVLLFHTGKQSIAHSGDHKFKLQVKILSEFGYCASPQLTTNAGN